MRIPSGTVEDLEGLWKAEDVAAYLQVAVQTVRNWRCDERIPYVRVMGNIRYVPDEIRRWAVGDRQAS